MISLSGRPVRKGSQGIEPGTRMNAKGADDGDGVSHRVLSKSAKKNSGSLEPEVFSTFYSILLTC